MSIAINSAKCTGCGRCRRVCPGGLLSADGAAKTEIRHPKDCWGCTACVKECRFGAIRYYLGADIGGRGGFLYTRREGSLLHWIIVSPDGGETVITVDSSRANTY